MCRIIILYRLLFFCIVPEDYPYLSRLRFIIEWQTSSWALTDSNRRPSACKADALNQLS